MTDPMISVECTLKDCIFYHTDPEQPGIVYCKHQDKPHHMQNDPCPLYRLNWQQRSKGAASDYLRLLKK